jgi:hypothetical protein
MLEIEVMLHGAGKKYCTSTFIHDGVSEMENYKIALKNVALGYTNMVVFVDDHTGNLVTIPPSMCLIECREVPEEMKEYKDFQAHNGLYEHKQIDNGEQWLFKFDNGYGASVLTGGIGYCNDEQPYELAVLHHDELCYDTPITDDVIGYLTSDEVFDLLDKIEQLESDGE